MGVNYFQRNQVFSHLQYSHFVEGYPYLESHHTLPLFMYNAQSQQEGSPVLSWCIAPSKWFDIDVETRPWTFIYIIYYMIYCIYYIYYILYIYIIYNIYIYIIYNIYNIYNNIYNIYNIYNISYNMYNIYNIYNIYI